MPLWFRAAIVILPKGAYAGVPVTSTLQAYGDPGVRLCFRLSRNTDGYYEPYNYLEKTAYEKSLAMLEKYRQ